MRLEKEDNCRKAGDRASAREPERKSKLNRAKHENNCRRAGDASFNERAGASMDCGNRSRCEVSIDGSRAGDRASAREPERNGLSFRK